MLRSEVPDFIFHHANVLTVDPQFRKAQAVAVSGNRVVTVGPNEEVLRLAGPDTRRVDLQGKTVIPGFIDGHVHASSYGQTQIAGQQRVRFEGCESLEEVLGRIKEATEGTPRGEWLQSSGSFDLDLVQDEGFPPTRKELDRVAPDHPFVMTIRGHFATLNTKALEVLGIAKDTPAPEGGYIFKDPDTGEPTGWLVDNAIYDYVNPKLPRATREEQLEGAKAANENLARMGYTGVLNQSGDAWDILQELKKRGELLLRWQANLKGSSNYFHKPVAELPKAVRDLGEPTGYGDEWVRVGSIGELHFDGWIHAPYTYESYAQHTFGPDWRGLLRHSREQLVATCKAAAEVGFQMEVHAVGDAALDMVLEVYEEVNRSRPITDKRWVITHGGMIPSQKALHLARELGVIVATQQPMLWGQSRFFMRYWGRRWLTNLFANRTWLDAGVMVNGGTDIVAPPLLGIYMCVARKNMFGDMLGPEQAITREEALRLSTINGAYSTFEEGIKGSIEVGKLADLVVLSDDVLTVPEEQIKEIEVLMTVVDGRIVYEKGENQSSG